MMKKLMLIAAALLVAGTVLGHGFNWSAGDDKTGNSGAFWQKMNTWGQAMHDTKVNASKTDTGIRLHIATPSKEAQKSLADNLTFSQKELSDYFQSVDVSVAEQDDGYTVEFSSPKESLVKRLQNAGPGLFYEYVQQRMFREMRSNGFGPRGGFGGHMGYGGYGGPMGQGYGSHMGYGGYGGHMGYGGYGGPAGQGYGMMFGGGPQGCPGYGSENFKDSSRSWK